MLTLILQAGELALKNTSSPLAGTEATGDQLLAVPQLLSVPPEINVLLAINIPNYLLCSYNQQKRYFLFFLKQREYQLFQTLFLQDLMKIHLW